MTALLRFGACLLTLCDFFLPLLQLLQELNSEHETVAGGKA